MASIYINSSGERGEAWGEGRGEFRTLQGVTDWRGEPGLASPCGVEDLKLSHAEEDILGELHDSGAPGRFHSAFYFSLGDRRNRFGVPGELVDCVSQRLVLIFLPHRIQNFLFRSKVARETTSPRFCRVLRNNFLTGLGLAV